MIFDKLRAGEAVNDEEFDVLYSLELRLKSKFHFTPIEVAKTAAAYLADSSEAKILDIGSGAGKFCLIGAACTAAQYTGVEQRETLVEISNLLLEDAKLPNATFTQANILNFNMLDFNRFYFFNSFYENIDIPGAIDDSVLLHRALYIDYCLHVRSQFDRMPIGTKIAAYFSYSTEIPTSYIVVDSHFDGKLKFWEKQV